MLRRQLGLDLRQRRESTGRTCADVAATLGWSESKLSRMETAKSGVRLAALDRLLDAYDVAQAEREQLRQLARQARQRAWWEAYGDALRDWYETYIGLESEAIT